MAWLTVSVLFDDELMIFTRLHDDTKARDMGQTDLALLFLNVYLIDSLHLATGVGFPEDIHVPILSYKHIKNDYLRLCVTG